MSREAPDRQVADKRNVVRMNQNQGWILSPRESVSQI